MTDCQGAHNLTGGQCAACSRLAPPTKQAIQGHHISPDLGRIDGRWICRSASVSSSGRNEPGLPRPAMVGASSFRG